MDENIKHIEYLIAQGEGLQLDFKFNISDSRKIAKSFVAFANTKGGTLLIGVKDNGAIAGIMSDEELFMLEAASNMYCKPEIKFIAKEWSIHQKTILEITVNESTDKPSFAQNEENKWLAYIRHFDKNILANKVMLKVWERQKSKEGTFIRYKKEEEFLLHFLEDHPFITLTHFCKLLQIPKHRAEKVLVNLICLKVIQIAYRDSGFSYSLERVE